MAGGSSSTNGSAPKDKRRRDAKEKARLAQDKLKETKKQSDELKRQLEELAKSHKDGENSENKDEYDRVKASFDSSGQTLQQVEEAAQQAQKEEEDVEMEDEHTNFDSDSAVRKLQLGPEESDNVKPEDETLFVPETGSGPPKHSFGSTPPPLLDLTDTKGNQKPPEIDEDPEDQGLFTPAHAKEASGRTDGGEVRAWTERANSTPVILSFGPPNARKYERSTAYRAGIPFDRNNTPRFGPDHRFGDKQQDRKFVRKWDEFKGIIGEAYNCSLDLLKPKEKGEKRTYPTTDLWVKWEIDGEIKRVWETRSSIKHLWPNPALCDEYIYESAKHHAKQYQDWLNGEREAKSKSPTPGPDMLRLMSQSTSAPETRIKEEDDDRNGSPSSGNKSQMAAMLEYREEWCALEGKDSTKMTPEDKANFLLSWNLIKVKL